MDVNLTDTEVFKIASHVEKRIARFYKIAAAALPDPVAKKLFEELGQMEDEHEKIFQALAEQLGTDEEAKKGDPGWTAVLATLISDVETDLTNRFVGKVDPVDILKEAMNFEKETIILFLALKNMLPEDKKSKIDLLIQEELGHLLQLGGHLAQDQVYRLKNNKFSSLGQVGDQPC